MDDVLARLIEKVENRYFGKYRAFVVDNADPESRGRLRLRVPHVLGGEVVSGWALPCAPYGGAANMGNLFIPEVEAGVWVEFEAGNLDYPVWVGTFWSKPGGESELPKPNDADGTEQGSVQDPPTRKIIKTLKGHTIQLEDADDEEMLLLVEAKNGNVIVMNKDGVTITDKTGNVIKMSDSAFQITAKVDFTIDATGQAVTIIGSTIDLNKA
ncbi:MAG: phage baseplate assembly protein V [Pyrinomonadaceae bacterium]